MKISGTNTGQITFSLDSVTKGMWSWPSPTGAPEGFVSLLKNLDLPGGMPTSMYGDSVFIDTAYAAASTVTLATTRKIIGSDPTPVIATSLGNVLYWTGAAWVSLRSSLSTAAELWWSDEQYGTDLFIANATDGVYRFDGTHLLPIGAKHIADGGSDEAADWTNETADTTNFKVGTQSVKVTSGNPGASALLTYNPSAAINTASGRLGARTYLLTKASGTDAYHFWVKFSAGATATITAATTTLVITDTGAKTLTWDATKWHSSKDSTSAAIVINTNDWKEVWVFPSDATESATFDPTIVDKLEFKVTTSAGQTDMSITDIYSVYLTTMPNVQIVKEWKNMLFGMQGDTYYFSKVAAPDQYDVLANSSLKSGGEGINGVARFFNQLTIGTDTHVFTISGSTQGSTYPAYLFDQNEVTDEIGIDSHRSIVKAENQLFWYWQGHIVNYNGTKAEHFSYPIDTLLDEIDNSKVQFIVGAPYRGKHEVWWTYRRTGQSVNDRVLKFDHQWKAFITVEGLSTPVLFKSSVSKLEKLLTIDETSRKIYVQNQSTSYTFVGTSIAYALEFPAMGVPGMSLQWDQNWLQYLNNTGNMLVKTRTADTLRALQGASYATSETVAMSTDGEYGKMRIGERATWLQLLFESTGTKMELQSPFLVTARQQPAEFVRQTP